MRRVSLLGIHNGEALSEFPSLDELTSSESNPVELVWWSLHEVVSRDHECSDLDALVEFAEGYLEESQSFMLKLGEVYEPSERSPP